MWQIGATGDTTCGGITACFATAACFCTERTDYSILLLLIVCHSSYVVGCWLLCLFFSRRWYCGSCTGGERGFDRTQGLKQEERCHMKSRSDKKLSGKKSPDKTKVWDPAGLLTNQSEWKGFMYAQHCTKFAPFAPSSERN